MPSAEPAPTKAPTMVTAAGVSDNDVRSFDWNGKYVSGIEWKAADSSSGGWVLPFKEGFKSIWGPDDVTPGFIEDAVRAEFAALELMGAHIFWLRAVPVVAAVAADGGAAAAVAESDGDTPFHQKRFAIIFPL